MNSRRSIFRSLLIPIGLFAAVACEDSAGPRPRPGDAPVAPPAPQSTVHSYWTDPRVVVPGVTDSVRVYLRLTDTATVHLHTRTGAYMPLRENNGVYQVSVAASALLAAYRTGDLHYLGGLFEISNSSEQVYLPLNVRDATVPAVNVRALGNGVQATARVLNLRYDGDLAGTIPNSLIREVYRFLGDEYDFIALIEAVHSPRNRMYMGVRNQVGGIGVPRFDHGRTYGSETRLQGIVLYPHDDGFDLAETGNLHELAHRWVNFTRVSALLPGAPHWPLSDLAYGIMGRSDARTGQPIEFPYQFVPQDDGGMLVQRAERPAAFNDLELYLMGLLPADSVRPHLVFRDQSLASQVRHNAILRGTVDTIRVADLVTTEGARDPAAAKAQRTFTIATVVLSRGRLLTNSEVSFFEHMAARGEAQTTLPYAAGSVTGLTKPFYLATGGRGRIDAKLRY
jgi:hypothetical protein